MRVIAPCPGERSAHAIRTSRCGMLEQRVKKKLLRRPTHMITTVTSSKKNDRWHYDDLCLGLCEPLDRARRCRRNNDLWLRLGRQSSLPDWHDHNVPLSVQMVFRCLVHGLGSKICDHHRLRVQWGQPGRNRRPGDGERQRHRPHEDSLYAPLSFGQHYPSLLSETRISTIPSSHATGREVPSRVRLELRVA